MLIVDSAVVMHRLDTLTRAVEALTAEVQRLQRSVEQRPAASATPVLDDAAPGSTGDRLRPRSKLLRQSDVCRELGISEQVWVRWRKTGTAPAPANVPGRRLFWNRNDIEQFAAQRGAG